MQVIPSSLSDDEKEKQLEKEFRIILGIPIVFACLSILYNFFYLKDLLIYITTYSFIMVNIGVYCILKGRHKKSATHDLITIKFFINFTYISLFLTAILVFALGAKYTGFLDYLR